MGALGALVLINSPGARADSAAVNTGFGRWDAELRRCQLHWAGEAALAAQRSSCLSVRLDQTIEGMLRVRFINAGSASRFASEELTFVGLLLKQDQPMQCVKGLCQPQWPMRLQVQGVATRRFDHRGVAMHLPLNQLAQGSCQLSAASLWCEARGPSGQRWSASAEPSQSQVGGRPAARPPGRTP